MTYALMPFKENRIPDDLILARGKETEITSMALAEFEPRPSTLTGG